MPLCSFISDFYNISPSEIHDPKRYLEIDLQYYIWDREER